MTCFIGELEASLHMWKIVEILVKTVVRGLSGTLRVADSSPPLSVREVADDEPKPCCLLTCGTGEGSVSYGRSHG